MMIVNVMISIIAMVVSIFSLIPTVVFAYELPDLGRSSVGAFTPSEEKKLGKEFIEEVRRSAQVVEDPIIGDYIQKLGQRLANNNANAMGRKFRFFVVQDPTVNAFAGPDGYIGVNTGLILATRSESELAAVLAHEIAHVSQHHLERSFKEVKGLNIPMAAALVAALLIGPKGGSATGNAATGVLMGAMAGGIQHMISFTRANEAEADRVGIATLYQAGFDVTAMSGFFARMQRHNLEYKDQIPPYLRTHPVTTERIADADNRVAQYHQHSIKRAALVAFSSHYSLVRARLQYFAHPDNLSAMRYFKMKLDNIGKKVQQDVALNNIDAMRYGYVLALASDHQWLAAGSNIDVLIKRNPHEVIYQMTKAQIQIATKQLDAAITTLKSAHVAQPNYYPLSMQYAQALTKAQQPQAAQVILKQQLALPFRSSSLTEPSTYATLADNAAKSGKLADAYLYRANALKIAGYYRDANVLLKQALRLPNLNPNMKALLQHELAVMKSLEREESKLGV